MFDVIVCGAGPAGAVAATVLARKGVRVLMLDRARFPRRKLCGDTINPGALAMLRRLGMSETFESAALELEGMIVTGEHGVSVRATYGGRVRALSIVRHVLDTALVRAATAAGARFEEGVLVRGTLVDETPVPRVRGIVMAGRDCRVIRVPAPFVLAAYGRRRSRARQTEASRSARAAIGATSPACESRQPFGECTCRGNYRRRARCPAGPRARRPPC